MNFARLPPVLLNVKGEKLNNPICHKRIHEGNFLSDGKECLMLGWGKHIYQYFSKRRSFLHVIETYISTFQDENGKKPTTVSLEYSLIVSTKPDLALRVRNWGWNKSRSWNNV